MDYDDSDDDLFKIASSQDTQEHGLDYGSDYDVILDDEYDVASTSWVLQEDTQQFETFTDDNPDAMLLDDIEEARNTQPVSLENSLSQTCSGRNRQWVVARIEQMIERILDGLLDDNRDLSIKLKTRSGLSRRDHNKASLPPPKIVEIPFPGATANDAWRFTVLLRILEVVHSSLIDNVVISKRDIYYRDTELFVKQSVVDRYVDDLACTFGVSRSSLNVTAAAKGLVAGNFSILRPDGTNFNGLSDQEGLLVPRLQDDDYLDASTIQHIVVMEKEAAFRSLLSSPTWDSLRERCLVMTAKGYPDLASRKFLRRLADHAPHIPMHILVDFDPDGINILSTYKYGSYRLAHEDGTDHKTPAINLPQLRWLGVQSHQLSRVQATGLITSDSTTSDDYGLIKMTARDRRKACQMLAWDVLAENGVESEWRRELQTMLMLNIKAEMQILEERSGGLASWLAEELQHYERPLTLGTPSMRIGDSSSEGVLDLL